MMRRSARGMTLLEVMVALTIAGVALAAGASVLGFLVDQRARSQADTIGAAVSVRESLRTWLAAADLGTAGDARFTGARMAAAPGEPARSTLDFVTRAPTPVAAGGDARTRIRIAVRHQPGTADALIAELQGEPRGSATTVLLAGDVASFSVRYRASVFGPPSWLDSWQSASVLPAVAEVRIGTITPSTQVGEALRTMPMTILLGERR